MEKAERNKEEMRNPHLQREKAKESVHTVALLAPQESMQSELEERYMSAIYAAEFSSM